MDHSHPMHEINVAAIAFNDIFTFILFLIVYMYTGEKPNCKPPVQRTSDSFGERHIAGTNDRGSRGRHAFCRGF